jgi:hypothetical protein
MHFGKQSEARPVSVSPRIEMHSSQVCSAWALAFPLSGTESPPYVGQPHPFILGWLFSCSEEACRRCRGAPKFRVFERTGINAGGRLDKPGPSLRESAQRISQQFLLYPNFEANASRDAPSFRVSARLSKQPSCPITATNLVEEEPEAAISRIGIKGQERRIQ